MRSALEYVRPQPWHLERLACTLRAEDMAEVAACGLSPFVALAAGARASSSAVVVLVAGVPVAAFGVLPCMLTGEGIVWLLGTQEIERRARELLRHAPEWIAHLGEGSRVLSAMAYAGNARALRWLRRMGFDVGPVVAHGPFGMPFRECRKVV